MSFARLKSELLAARDAREAVLAALLDGAAATLVAVSSAVPGPDKTPPGSAALFAWGLRQLHQRLGACQPLAAGEDALGPYRIVATVAEPWRVKAVGLAIETAISAARLLDFDVYAANGSRIGRAEIGQPARRCLLCAEPATDCIRLNRHPMERLLDHVGHLLAPFTDALPDAGTGGAAGRRLAMGTRSHPQAGTG